MQQGRHTRALDSRGRPVPGLYQRDGRLIAGFKLDGRWMMKTLEAETLTDARRERESLLAGLREGLLRRPPPPSSRCSPSSRTRARFLTAPAHTSSTSWTATSPS